MARSGSRRLASKLLTLAVLGWGGAAVADPSAAANGKVVSMAASRVLDAMGVNVHLEFTDGRYADVEEAIADLDYLGIHRLRDIVPNPDGGVPYRNYMASLDRVIAAGNRLDFVFDGRQPAARGLQQVDHLAAGHPGAIFAVEGPDEIGSHPVSFDGVKGENGATLLQRDLFLAASADRRIGAVAVYSFTGGMKVDLDREPKLADAGSVEVFPDRAESPASALARASMSAGLGERLPKVVTRAGFATPSTDDHAAGLAASRTLALVFDAMRQGCSSVFLYQLRSAYPERGDGNKDVEFGLFRLDNSPRPAAVAIHNLRSILADTAPRYSDLPRFQEMPVISISGRPTGVGSLLLTKSDSIFDLVLWAEPVVARGVKVGFVQPFARAVLFDPARAASPVARYGAGSEISVELNGGPMIIEFKMIPRAS